jgi:hypothetical protein
VNHNDPDSASHIFEECWQFIGDLSQMPTFSSRSEICQSAMLSFCQGLSRFSCDAWIPHPVAEAPGKLAKIATHAAISRVRPISDGPDQWEMYRQGTYTGSQSSLGLSVPGLGALPKPVTLFPRRRFIPPSPSCWATAGKALKVYEGRVQRDRGVATRSRRPSRALSDGAGGTLRGPPA